VAEERRGFASGVDAVLVLRMTPRPGDVDQVTDGYLCECLGVTVRLEEADGAICTHSLSG
jgi:hypothetical protein